MAPLLEKTHGRLLETLNEAATSGESIEIWRLVGLIFPHAGFKFKSLKILLGYHVSI